VPEGAPRGAPSGTGEVALGSATSRSGDRSAL